jgi:hypothetical protein
MNSVELCLSWLKNEALFLDTETTSVDESAEIIEIAVINNGGLRGLNLFLVLFCFRKQYSLISFNGLDRQSFDNSGNGTPRLGVTQLGRTIDSKKSGGFTMNIFSCCLS